MKKKTISFFNLVFILSFIYGILYYPSLVKGEIALCEPQPSSPVVAIAGDVIITALLDGHAGENCSLPVTKGLQQIAATAWAVSSTNNLNLIPGVTIGLEVFDTCTNERATQRAVLSAFSQAECSERYSLGVLSTEKGANSVISFLEALDVQLFPDTFTDSTPTINLVHAAAALVRALNRSEAAVLSYSIQAVRDFSFAASQRNICVTWEELLIVDSGEEISIAEKIPITGTVVMIAPWSVIRSEANSINTTNEMDLHWVLVPTDETWENIEEELDSMQLRPDTWIIACTAAAGDKIEQLLFGPRLQEVADWAQNEVPGQILQQVTQKVLGIVSQLQVAIYTDCGTELSGICSDLRPLTQHTQTESLEDNIADAVSIPPESWLLSVDPEIRIGRVLNSPSLKLEVILTLEASATMSLEVGEQNIASLPRCEMCVCLNVVTRQSVWQFLRWRHQVWVAAVVSITSVGVVCAVAIAIFIAVRICKGDVLEGNPTFSFVLLFSVVLTYLAVLPFCASGPRFLCTLRELGTSLGHALLLATMLARAIMLATTDDQGFMSHVNGFLQASLWFFMLAVQVALTVQLWILESPLKMSMNSELDSTDHGGTVPCSSDGAPFLLMLSYDMFLLLLLLLICPLVARSKRNYREGLCFTVATILYTISWLTWLAAYILAPSEWRAPSAAAGLVASASTVLVAVFIPRTYLMVSSVARARIASALPCTAAGLHTSSVLDINYRSSHQALYDSVNPVSHCSAVNRSNDRISPRASPAVRGVSYASTGLANPNYYSEHPGPSGSAASTVIACRGGYSAAGENTLSQIHGGTTSRDQLSPSPDNTYERYDIPPSPHKVTRF